MLESRLKPTGLAVAGQAAREDTAGDVGAAGGAAARRLGDQAGTAAAAWTDEGGAWPATRVLRLEPWQGMLSSGAGGGSCGDGAVDVGREEVEQEAGGAGPESEAMGEAEGKGGRVQSGAGGSPVLVRYVPPNPNPSNSNSAIYYLAQVGNQAGGELPCYAVPTVPRTSPAVQQLHVQYQVCKLA